jgi:hypothetical protein
LNSSFKPGEIISYTEMCSAIGVSLQRGMNFRLQGKETVILMSVRPDAPYADRIEDEGKILIYEGHDCPKKPGGPNPKTVDQPEFHHGGAPTQNGRFAEAARNHKKLGSPPEMVRVFEKIRDGIWVYNGVFELLDCWQELSENRKVFKFKLKLTDSDELIRSLQPLLDDDRIIPSWVKQEVWKRDHGKCTICAISVGLHFDHIIPYSKGGSSKDPANIQILCGRHNLAKRDKIE